MTPEERARKWAHSIGIVDLGSYEGMQIIAAAIREAVAEEREACAVLAETQWNHHRGCSAARGLVKAGAMAIAEDIRARSESEVQND